MQANLMIYPGLLVRGVCKELNKKGSIKVGILCQYVVDKTGESPNPPFPSARMAQLFYEFLGRYNDWKLARRQETIGLIIVLVLGLLALIIPWVFPNNRMTVSFAMLTLFYFATRKYIELNEQASHLYVNVNILYHHFIGKLEVGFCDHREPCQCAENFRGYVPFDTGSLRQR